MSQRRSQNLKEVPQNIMEVFNADDVTDNDVIQKTWVLNTPLLLLEDSSNVSFFRIILHIIKTLDLSDMLLNI